MNKTISILLGLAILLGSARPALAQSGVVVSEAQALVRFGEQIQFSARIQSPIQINSATVSFRPADGIAQTRALTFNADGTAGYTFDASLNTLTPFVQVTYWFDVTLADGTLFNSDMFSFRYDDNRFTWQTREDGATRVHWYNGDAAFGTSALDATLRGLDSARGPLNLDSSAGVEVYVYASDVDLQGSLALGGQDWVAGHASPALGVVVVSVAPGDEQGIEFERQIPHEISHVLLYRQVGPFYGSIPLWLREGLATQAELYPNPDFAAALEDAAQSNTLIPLTDLCDSFPTDATGAFLAYAEAESFTRYLLNTYGGEAFANLATAYVDGLDCDSAPVESLGASLSQLDVNWRETVLGENRTPVILAALLPYLILLALILIVPLWGIIGILRKRGRRG